jgi:hypothetical protein
MGAAPVTLNCNPGTAVEMDCEIQIIDVGQKIRDNALTTV